MPSLFETLFSPSHLSQHHLFQRSLCPCTYLPVPCSVHVVQFPVEPPGSFPCQKCGACMGWDHGPRHCLAPCLALPYLPCLALPEPDRKLMEPWKSGLGKGREGEKEGVLLRYVQTAEYLGAMFFSGTE